MKKGLFFALTVMSLGAFIVGIVSAQAQRTLHTFTVTLNGQNEVPADTGDPDGTGTAVITIDDQTTEVCINVTTSNVATLHNPVNLVNIREGAVGEEGFAIIHFNIEPDSDGIFSKCMVNGNVFEVLANPTQYYVNLQTKDHPAGAVRGQVALVPPATHTPNPTSTPQATATAEATTPVITPTENTPTATETAAVLPRELLTNNGFEESSLAPWRAKRATEDKVRCNRVGIPGKQDKIFAFNGECAYRFKGGVGERSKLFQTVDVSNIQTGDTLVLSLYARTDKLMGKAVAVVKAQFADSDPVKVGLDFAAGSTGYTLKTLAPLVLNGVPTQLTIEFNNRASRGSLLIDEVSLTLYKGAAFLALP